MSRCASGLVAGRVDAAASRDAASSEHAHPGAPRLLGLGTARPSLQRSQADACGEIGDMLGLERAERARWERIWRGTGIDTRHSVCELSEVLDLGTAARMRLFDHHATTLAASAARNALGDARIDASSITDLVVVTCTGFSAPGVPRRLLSELRLGPGVRTSQIGFMGCFGGVCGMRSAAAHAAADPRAVVLLVCVELCSLHLRRDRDPQNLVASALFADGAAAAVLSAADDGPVRAARSTGGTAAGGAHPSFVVRPGASRTVDGTLDAMSWIITDAGFAMTLSREVPRALSAALPGIVPEGATVLLHPGGPAVIDAVESSIDAAGRGAIEHSRLVLREGGNMSSATVLFVLERWRRAGGSGDAALVAFGPGLTVDVVELVAATGRSGERHRRIVSA